MIDFKRKALILTLAATVSVTGSFAADNYKNCLMDMEFNSSSNNEINVTLNTKNPYNGRISPIKKDATTYIIMLPETDNQAPSPNLNNAGNCIKSVEIKKMPYLDGNKGYTKIMIKTEGLVNLKAKTALYIPSANSNRQSDDTQTWQPTHKLNTENTDTIDEKPDSEKSSGYRNGRRYDQPSDNNLSADPQNQITAIMNKAGDLSLAETSEPEELSESKLPNEESHQKGLLGMLAVFIILISIYLYIKAQDKLTNVMGEKLIIDLDNDNDNENSKQNKGKRHKISNAINKLDNLYSKTASYSMKTYFDDSNTTNQNDDEEEIRIVDLDTIYREQQFYGQNDNNDNAFDDFLSEYLSNEEPENIEKDYDTGYDKEAYEELINNKDIVFSQEDITCFNELLQSEIDDDTLQNIDKYLVSNPLHKQKLSQSKKLELLAASYTINQNITFTHDDIDILKKLISVELDEDFVKDLSTNKKRTQEMEKEINSSSEYSSNVTNLLTLHVKDLLPNLSEALKKQGNRPIVSEYKPKVADYNQGYGDDKLSMAAIELPNFAKELKTSNPYASVPSAKYEVVDKSYINSVNKISISGLPDLEDVMANPDKYEDAPVEEYIPDENAMLNSIMNVQFKPFDDGTRSFEIINEFDKENETKNANMPAINIKEEFSQFDNFEISYTDETKDEPFIEEDKNDFESIYDTNYVDLDKVSEQPESKESQPSNVQNMQEKSLNKDQEIPNKAPASQVQNQPQKPQATDKKESFIPKNLEKTNIKKETAPKEPSDKVANILEQIKSEKKEVKKESTIKSHNQTSTVKSNNISKTSTNLKCILNGINYDIIDSSAFNTEFGCHLAKSNINYVVLAYKGNELSIIKEYDSLKSEKIMTRLTESLPDGTPRYLVKVSTNKFIVDIKDGQVKYVMDLC